MTIYQPNSSDFYLESIRSAAHDLRGHSSGRPQRRIFDLGVILCDLQLLRKPKINDFISPIVRHDVFCLQIAMHNSMSMQLHQPIDNVLQYHPSLVLGDSLFLFNLSLQRVAFAEL